MTKPPEGFLWGAATADHQIEGNNTNSNVWALEHAPDSPLLEHSGDACDSYLHWSLLDNYEWGSWAPTARGRAPTGTLHGACRRRISFSR